MPQGILGVSGGVVVDDHATVAREENLQLIGLVDEFPRYPPEVRKHIPKAFEFAFTCRLLGIRPVIDL